MEKNLGGKTLGRFIHGLVFKENINENNTRCDLAGRNIVLKTRNSLIFVIVFAIKIVFIFLGFYLLSMATIEV